MDSFIVARAEERAKLWTEAKNLAETAASEKRELDATEREQFDKITAEIDRLDGTIKEMSARAEAAKAADEARARFAAVVAPTTTKGENSDEAELRSILRGEKAKAVFTRDLTKSSGGPNPTDVYGQVIGVLTVANPLVDGRFVTVLNTATGNSIAIPTGTALSTAALVGEGSGITPSDPTMGTKTLGAYKYATLIPVSNELLNDAAFNASAYVAEQAGRSIGLAFQAHQVAGNGTGEPAGIADDATVGVTGTSAAPNYENLVDLVYSVASPYRASGKAAFLANSTTIASLRKLTDGSGQYIWTASAVPGQPDTLLGFPVIECSSIAAPGVGDASVLFGDLSRVFVRIAGGVEIATDSSVGFANDLTYVRALLRADSVLTDAAAVKKFVGGVAGS